MTKKMSSGYGSASYFIRKRIARIVPLYWLATLWVTRRTPPDLNLLRDFLFIPHYNAQYPNMINPILIQGWTLNYEMLFYGLFGLCLLFPRRTLVLVLTLAALPLAGALLPGVYGEFYGRNIVLEFGFGVLLQLAVARWGLPQWHRLVWLAVMAVGFAGLIAGYDSAPRALTQGLPATLIVWSSMKACEGWLRLYLLRLLGDASYAIYLFHWPSFGAVKPLTALLGPEWITSLMVAHILMAAVSGCLIHLIIEKRLTHVANIWLGLRPRLKLAYAP